MYDPSLMYVAALTAFFALVFIVGGLAILYRDHKEAAATKSRNAQIDKQPTTPLEPIKATMLPSKLSIRVVSQEDDFALFYEYIREDRKERERALLKVIEEMKKGLEEDGQFTSETPED